LRRLGANAGSTRTNKEHALSFPRNHYDPFPPLPNFHRSVIFVLDLPPGGEAGHNRG
jgi:hypothetical protein